ncbi:MAG: UPF0149 family protein [Gammaproteobacteria bacterium]
MTDEFDPIDSDAIDDTLEYFFDKYSSDDSILTLTELDGFFAGLACAPEIPMPSQWLPVMWGGDSAMPDWEEQEEIEEFHEALMVVYNSVMLEFMENDYIARIYSEDDQFMMVDEWCDGFLRAVRLYGLLAPEDQAFLDKQLEPIRLFSTQEGVDELLEMTPQQLQEQAALIEPNVRALRQHFFSRQVVRAHTPLMVAEPSPGRNDPCPCGSGKKFKKCCLH